MKKINSITYLFFCLCVVTGCATQNHDPFAARLITSDLDNFRNAIEKRAENLTPATIEELYLSHASKGVKGFMENRIVSSERLAKVVESHHDYYYALRHCGDSIITMKPVIVKSFLKLKELYPEATFPSVYFVIGALNSGGTTSGDALIIGTEMYALTPATDLTMFSPWLKTVLRPINEMPHIVAHELIHFQQDYSSDKSLLAAAIKEGSADFISQMISGKNINQHVHDFALPREQELWLEFKTKMYGNDFAGWLYSSSGDRPNDLGYWMGYQITKAYYDKATDKKKAIRDILHIRDFKNFLSASGYSS